MEDKYLKRLYNINSRKGPLKFWFAKVIYSDNKKFKNVDKATLYCEKHMLSGKPDYIYKTLFGKYIPVELKSSSIKDKAVPRENELMQLASYFFIVNENYGKCKKGYLVYNDKVFVVKNTRRGRKYFLNILNNMRSMMKTGRGECEPSFVKCKYCICRGTVCEHSE